MTLAIILIVLLIDRVLWQGDPLREHRWYDRYTDRMLSLATGQWLTRMELGALWLLLPPLLVVGLLQMIAGNTAGLVIGVLILLFALGPRDLGRDTAAYLNARERDDESATAKAAALACDGVPPGEPERSLAVASGVLEQSLPRLFGPLLWFILLGPLGAALYRLTEMTATRSATHPKAPASLGRSARRLLAVLDWLPARLAAAAFAAAGNFDAVQQAWRNHPGDTTDPADAHRLLRHAGQAALHSWPDQEEIDAGEQPPVVEDALALVWRALAVWLLVLFTLTLIVILS